MSEELNKAIEQEVPEDDFINEPKGDDEFGVNKEIDIEAEELDVEGLKRELENLTNKYTRICADFSNYRKRNENQTAEIEDFATVSVLKQLLPLFDSFASMSFENATKESLETGLISLKNQMNHILSKIGVEEIYTDDGYNHKYHEAVATTCHDDKEDGEITKVYMTGYKYKNKVLRPSMVEVVSKN